MLKTLVQLFPHPPARQSLVRTFAMPKLARGCYEKIGYPSRVTLSDDTFVYMASGATRMLYVSQRHPSIVAKVMPARSSKHWKPSWVQNRVEADSLRKLASLDSVPHVYSHGDIPFVNTWGEMDVMDVLVVDKLGPDLQAAATKLDFVDFSNAYLSTVHAIEGMAHLDVVVPDPHPYNCSLLLGSNQDALPCDFGAAVPTSSGAIRKSLKNLFGGFRNLAQTSYGMDTSTQWENLAHFVSHAEMPLGLEFWRHCTQFFQSVGATSRVSTSDTRAPPSDEWSWEPTATKSSPPSPPSEPWSWEPTATKSSPPSPAITFALVYGLNHQVNLNGKAVFVKEVLGERCVVKFQDLALKSVPTSALRPIEHPTGAWICHSCKADVYWKACPDETWTGSKGKWKCGQCSSGTKPASTLPPPPQQQAPTAPPPAELVIEAFRDSEKQTILNYMVWLMQSARPREDRKAFYKSYLLSHHADHHPEWREAGMEDVIIRQVELCDFVKRTRRWFLVELE